MPKFSSRIMDLKTRHVVHRGTTLSKPLQVPGLHSRLAESEIFSGEAVEICIAPNLWIVSCGWEVGSVIACVSLRGVKNQLSLRGIQKRLRNPGLATT